MPDGAGFPVVRFEALAFLPGSFPNEMRFKGWCTYAPSALGLTTGSKIRVSEGKALNAAASWARHTPTLATRMGPLGYQGGADSVPEVA